MEITILLVLIVALLFVKVVGFGTLIATFFGAFLAIKLRDTFGLPDDAAAFIAIGIMGAVGIPLYMLHLKGKKREEGGGQ